VLLDLRLPDLHLRLDLPGEFLLHGHLSPLP
jgi:hypothetical protein